MNTALVALALAYVFLLLLLLLAILRSEVGPGIKLTLVGLSFGFYLWHYTALQDAFGWPARDALPEHFELISAVTVEPDLQRDQSGSIFIWVRDLDDDTTIPRAYRLDYRKPLHQQVDATIAQQRQGERFVGRPVSGNGSGSPQIEFENAQRNSGARKSSGVPE